MDVPPIVSPWYSDKAIWAKILLPVVTMLVAYLNTKLPVPLTPDQLSILIGGMIAGVVTFIVMHKKKTQALQALAMTQAAGAAAAANPAPVLNK